jgi:hypothetical protein
MVCNYYRGLQTKQAAVAGRNTRGTPHVGGNGCWAHPAGYRRGTAPTRAPRRALEGVWVVAAAVHWVVALEPH